MCQQANQEGTDLWPGSGYIRGGPGAVRRGAWGGSRAMRALAAAWGPGPSTGLGGHGLGGREVLNIIEKQILKMTRENINSQKQHKRWLTSDLPCNLFLIKTKRSEG